MRDKTHSKINESDSCDMSDTNHLETNAKPIHVPTYAGNFLTRPLTPAQCEPKNTGKIRVRQSDFVTPPRSCSENIA